jgi:alkylhydroperoxidase family enzyme
MTATNSGNLRQSVFSGDVHLPVPPAGPPPRLAPIEHPRGLRLRLAYWGMRRSLGKVATPVKVVIARAPESLPIVSGFRRFSDRHVTLDKDLQLLITDLVSQINGCEFCLDLGRSQADRYLMNPDKLLVLHEFRTNPLFTPKERAALEYVDQATRNKRVTDDAFQTLRHYFSDRQIVEITLLNAIENFYNMTNLPLGIGSDGFCSIPDAAGSSRS